MGIIRQNNWDLYTPYGSAGGNNPTLLISEGTLINTAQQFIENFPGKVSYAVKANSDKRVIEILYNAGVHSFDVASTEEMANVRTAAPFATLHYHNPVRSRDEISTALEQYKCRRFAIDHMSELEKLRSMVADPQSIEVAIRFAVSGNSHAVQDFSSKFGAKADECVALVRTANEMGFRVGLTFHPGSQTVDPQPYEQCIAQAANLANSANCDLQFLNVGGGFPSRYAGSGTIDHSAFFTAIRRASLAAFSGYPPKLECEPGRGIVAPAATLITTIKSVRRDRAELFLNDGIYGGLMEGSQFPELFPRYTHCSNSMGSEESAPIIWKAFGPTCDPVDVLPCALQLPGNVAEGDFVSFHGLGAYCSATATRFNGYGDIQTIIQPASAIA